MHRGKNHCFHTGSGHNGTQTGKPRFIFNCGKLGCCFFTVMQTVCVWSQSHLDPPLTSSKEGPGVQDFFKKRRNRESAYGWSDAIALASLEKVLRAITKEASVFFRLQILLLSLAGHDDD